MPLTVEQSAKLTQWWNAGTQLEVWKREEAKLRLELVKELFNSDKDSGSESIEIGGGYILKATKKLDYKLDNKQGQVEAVAAILDDELEKKLIKWKPELSVSTYKEQETQTQKLFDGCLTIKPGMPSLELIPPKAEK